MSNKFYISLWAAMICLSLSACQAPMTARPGQVLSTQSNRQTPVLRMQPAASAPPLKTYAETPKIQPQGQIERQGNTLKLKLKLPPLEQLGFKSQALYLANASKIVATVTDSHGKSYTPVGAVAGEVNYPVSGEIDLSFENVIPDPLLLVDLQVKDGSGNIPQAALAAALRHESSSPASTPLDFQTAAVAQTLKHLLTLNASRARDLSLSDLNTLMLGITGQSGTAPNFSYGTHPSLVNTTQLATDLVASNPGSLTASTYRRNGATVDITVSGLLGSDKIQVQVTDAASAVRTNLGNGLSAGNVANLKSTPGSGIQVRVSPFGTPVMTYSYNVTPTPPLTLSESVTQALTITATPDIAATSLNPTAGIPGSNVIITGTGFTGTAAVEFTGPGSTWIPATYSVDSHTQITTTVPAGAIDGPIRVSNGGQAQSPSFDVNRIWFVNTAASGSNIGTSWANAFSGISGLQAALTASGSGDQIWVAAGKYSPGNLATHFFQMKTGVNLYGGFVGGETLLSQRNSDPASNNTVLSGDIGNDDTGSGASYAYVGTNNRRVIYGANNAILDGFTIQGGHNLPGNGAGLYNDGVSPTVRRVIFSNNTSGGDSGGAYNRNATSVVYEDVRFYYNIGASGGGLACINSPSNCTLERAVFQGNQSNSGVGGGIFVSNGFARIRNVLLLNNQSSAHGGGIAMNATSTELINLTLVNNTATGFGPGLYKNGSGTPVYKNLLLWNSPYGDLGSGSLSGTGHAELTGTAGDANDPFVNVNAPFGTDTLPLTSDDGLRIKAGAALINTGVTGADVPSTDILGLTREGNPEPGAFEYITPPPQTYYVKANASGSNNGSSWANAFSGANGLQAALSVAVTGDQIWVAAGKYTPGSAQTDSIQMKTGVNLYGGFVGGETLLSQRNSDPASNNTLLSGDIDNNDTGSGASYARVGSNSFTILRGANNATLDGFTVQGGDNQPGGSGGGMNNVSVSPTVRNCIFSDNHTISGGGGGMKVFNAPSLTVIENVTFARNSSLSSGGGLSIQTGSNVQMHDLRFLANQVTGGGANGGGMTCVSSTCDLERAVFHGNSASNIGGGLLASSAVVNLRNLSFSQNSATLRSAGAELAGGTGTASNLSFVNNTAPSPSGLRNNSPASFKNLLLWNDSYSSSTVPTGLAQLTGTTGDANDPFINSANPLGSDGVALTSDDGLRIKAGAALINTGVTGADVASTDILNRAREGNPEPGAYEYITLPPQTYYVKANASGSNNGSSWANAFSGANGLQAALSEAASGDQIWVASGRYSPGSAQTDSFQMKAGVNIYGGFVGTETLLSQRNSDPASNNTVLSGDIGNDDTGSGASYTHVGTNNRSVIKGANSATLDGFTISGGNQTDPAFDTGGGGMCNIGVSPTLVNLRLMHNRSIESGGGMYNRNASPSLTQVSFLHNVSDLLGGGMNNDNAHTNLTQVRFESNRSLNDGGGAGMYSHNGSSGSLNQVSFVSNSAMGTIATGGGLFHRLSSAALSLNQVSFVGNSAAMGGGMSIESASNISMQRVVFANNTTSTSGGALGLYGDSSASLNNVMLAGNTAPTGSGIYHDGSAASALLKLVNVTLANHNNNALQKVGSVSLSAQNVLCWNSTYNLGALPGTGNTQLTGTTGDANDPFVDSTNPLGSDGVALTSDDGLALRVGSLLAGTGVSGADVASTDILGQTRIGTPEPGAYEYLSNLPAGVIPVWASASGNNSGYGWANAFSGSNGLQSALAQARSGQEIWVAAGKYIPGTVDTDSFQLKSGVNLYGGFVGSETTRSARNSDPLSNNTVLSGDIGNDDTGSGASYVRVGTNNRTVLLGANSTTLDGFTISGAHRGSTNTTGGGMFNNGVSPTLVNLRFINNQAFRGGAIYNSTATATPSISQVRFEYNITTSGGGAIWNNAALPNLSQVYFGHNQSGIGGAIYNSAGAHMTLTRGFFINNSASSFAGAIANVGASPTISNTVLVGNSATNEGGALFNNGAAVNPLYVNLTLANNSAADGGGIYHANGATSRFRNSLFWNSSYGVGTLESGQGNLSLTGTAGDVNDPFVDSNTPLGANGVAMSSDDGLRIKAGAALINTGITGVDIPLIDILGLTRSGNPEPGAYEYF